MQTFPAFVSSPPPSPREVPGQERTPVLSRVDLDLNSSLLVLAMYLPYFLRHLPQGSEKGGGDDNVYLCSYGEDCVIQQETTKHEFLFAVMFEFLCVLDPTRLSVPPLLPVLLPVCASFLTHDLLCTAHSHL